MSGQLALIEPRFKIRQNRWEEFKTHVNSHYPKDHFTHEQKDFIHRSLLHDNGRCSDIDKFWINIFADHLLEYVGDSWPTQESTISEQMEFLNVATSKAILGFFNSQYALRQNITHGNRTPEQQRMLAIHPNIYNFPIDLSIDLGRILRLQNVKVQHEDAANQEEIAEDQHLFHILHTRLMELSKQGVGPVGSTSTGAQPETAKGQSSSEKVPSASQRSVGSASEALWSPFSVEDTFMRLCCYKVWSEKYEQEEEWSPSKMVNEWLKEAIQLYNHVSYHWNSVKVKNFPEEEFKNIRHTAMHSWVPDIVNRAVASYSGKKPTTHWVTDWCTPPVTEKRHEWESYYCSVMLRSKNLAKLLHKRDVMHVDLTEEQEGKRQRTDESQAQTQQPSMQFDIESLEHKIQQIVRHEINKVERHLKQTDRNLENLHSDLLRELVGHFKPVRTQLHQLGQGQGHIYNMIDNLNRS